MSKREVDLQLEGHATRSRNGTGLIETNPTLREIEILIAKVEYGSNKAAAHALGLSEQTMKNHISSVLTRIQASHITHAIWMMWPVLKDYWNGVYRPRPVASSHPLRKWHPGLDPDRRTGYQRRKYIPKPSRATYNPARQSYVQGYVEHIGDLCVPAPDEDRKG